MNIPVSLLHTFVVDTVLTFPTPFNIILAYNKTSRVNAITQAYYTEKKSRNDAKCRDCAYDKYWIVSIRGMTWVATYKPNPTSSCANCVGDSYF